MRPMLVLALLGGAAFGVWRWAPLSLPGPNVSRLNGSSDVRTQEITPERAAEAEARIRAFRTSEASELRLDADDVSALLRYSLADMLPEGVLSPRVALDLSQVEIQAEVVPGALASLFATHPVLAGASVLFPDTVAMLVRGSLASLGARGSMFVVEAIEVEGLPIPEALYADILVALGRERAPEVPPGAVVLPAVDGIGGAHVADGNLVLLRP